MSKLVRNWDDVAKLTSSKFEMITDEDGCSAWIVPKVQGKNNVYIYISSHLFDKYHYMIYTELLNVFGFYAKVICKDDN